MSDESGQKGGGKPPRPGTSAGTSGDVAGADTPSQQPGSATQQGSPQPVTGAIPGAGRDDASPNPGPQGAAHAGGAAPAQSPDDPASPQVQLQLSPLSIQAAALVKCIDRLSNIFWISFAGTFLSIFFTSLNQLNANAASDHIFLGEYQVPKSILPVAAVGFAVFVFWLTANRLKVLQDALHSTVLPAVAVHEIFRLNPPVLHVFQTDNLRTWSPTSGVNVFIMNWAVFFGNSAALTWSSALQQGAYFGQFNPTQLVVYVLFIVAVIVYGTRAIIPPMRSIIGALHDVPFRLGWPRQVMALVLAAAVFAINQWDQVQAPGDQSGEMIGPVFANAIDGETLFLGGSELKLFGIDAVEDGQVCQDAAGDDYACGRQATQALQSLLQQHLVVCLPFFAIGENRLVAHCEVVPGGEFEPLSPLRFVEEHRPNNLSRLMVAKGHALAVGVGARLFGAEQDQAQRLRQGIWQGSFQPPSTWRRQSGNP